MTVLELTDRLAPILRDVRALQLDMSRTEPSPEMGVALGTIAVVVLSLSALIDGLLDMRTLGPGPHARKLPARPRPRKALDEPT